MLQMLQVLSEHKEIPFNVNALDLDGLWWSFRESFTLQLARPAFLVMFWQ